MKLKDIVTTLAFALIFAFVFIFSTVIFNVIFIQPDQAFFQEGLSAFMGAFFAFLFLRLSEFLTRVYQRELKHYNSLVNLETQLNETGGIIHDNIYIVQNFQRVILSGNVYFNNLHQIPMDKSHYENLYDIDLINDLFTYYYQVRKINDDVQTSVEGYQEIKSALIQHNIDKNDYMINVQSLANTLKSIEAFFVKLEKDTVVLMAKIRIKERTDKPLGAKLQSFFLRSSKINEKQLLKEVTLLKEEIESTKTASQEEIEKILRENNLIR